MKHTKKDEDATTGVKRIKKRKLKEVEHETSPAPAVTTDSRSNTKTKLDSNETRSNTSTSATNTNSDAPFKSKTDPDRRQSHGKLKTNKKRPYDPSKPDKRIGLLESSVMEYYRQIRDQLDKGFDDDEQKGIIRLAKSPILTD